MARRQNPPDCPHCGSANYFKVKEVPKEWGGGSFYECLECHSMYMYAPGAEREGVCDFCGSRPIFAKYPCRDFEYPVSLLKLMGMTDRQGQGSEGPWAACEPCYKIIQHDAGEKSKARRLLIRRAMEIHDIPRSIRSEVEPLYQFQFNMFFKNQTGNAILLG